MALAIAGVRDVATMVVESYMSDMPTVALAGAGFMAGTHVTQYSKMEDVSVLAVAAPSGPEEFIDEHGLDADAYTDSIEMMDAVDVDFVDVCTPTHTHRDVVEPALERGFDVFCEKPLARTIADAEAIVDAAADADATCFVGHVVRFFPQYEAAKQEVDDEAVGRPGVARARRLSIVPDWGSNDWFNDQAKSGGVFLDLAIHDFDYLRWVWGDVERVFARQSGPDANHGHATLRFESGAVGHVETSWAEPSGRGFATELEFAGDEGVVQVDDEHTLAYREYDDDGVTFARPLDPNGYYRELQHFIECLQGDAEPAVTVEDAIAAMRISLAARESAATGEPVAPAEVDQ